MYRKEKRIIICNIKDLMLIFFLIELWPGGMTFKQSPILIIKVGDFVDIFTQIS